MSESKQCSLAECQGVKDRRGFCNAHYIKWRRYGDPLASPLTPEARFMKKVQVQEGGCWNWTGAQYTPRAGGYAQFTVNNSKLKAHIWSYRHFVGPIPSGLQLDHECRNRICVNPRHLRPVTNKQNQENRSANRNNPTGVRGVRQLQSGRWNTRVRHNGVEHTAGTFDTLEDAETAVTDLRNRLFTHNSEDRREWSD